MGEFREYLEEKCLSFTRDVSANEALTKIFFNNKELTWNPNKTEKDFKDRIKQRTELSEVEFMKTIQKGIKIKEKEIPIDSSICMYFFISKFILIINTKEMIITTIRDGRWFKPTNGCKNILLLNEDVIKMDQAELDVYNAQEYFIIDVNENFDLILESKCNYCFKVDL